MGKTIRTIIVLLAAVMLLAGCDPKMGNQGGFGTQGGGEESRTGETLNGIEFPWFNKKPNYEEPPNEDARPLWDVAYGFLMGFINSEEDAVQKCDVITHRLGGEGSLDAAFHLKLKPGQIFEIRYSNLALSELEVLTAQVGNEPGKCKQIIYYVGKYHHKGSDPETDTRDFISVSYSDELSNDATEFVYVLIDGKYSIPTPSEE